MAPDADRPEGAASGRSDEHLGGGARADRTAASGLVGDPGHHVELAERALVTGSVVGCDCCGLIVAPDVVILEGLANGQVVDESPTLHLRRWDGRSAWIYSTRASLEVAR